MSIIKTLENIVVASRTIATLKDEEINAVLNDLADAAVANTSLIIAANAKDLARMDRNDSKYDRLLLNADRINAIASDIRNVATLPSPLGKIQKEYERPNGLKIKRITVPIGVIGIIYEARPNVTFDVFSLCFKSGNATVLKGGSDAHDSNTAIVAVIHQVLIKHGLDVNMVQLLPADREATAELLKADKYVDLIIPRGSQGLIDFVRKNSLVPVVETGAGIVHTYFDVSGDKEKGKAIVNNAKTRRVSVCNALDCLIIHKDRLSDLPYICSLLANSNVELFADAEAFAVLHNQYPASLLKPATEESFGTEFLSYKMAVKTVQDIDEAIAHIFNYSSKHSEAIIAEDKTAITQFLQQVVA